MSQGSAGEAAMTSDTPMQMGGQVQPVDAEGTMNGFTAVNGRTSPPSQTAKQPVAETGRDETSQPPREPSQRPNVDGGQAHAYGEDSQMGTPSINGHLKRKRSIDDGQSSDASDRSSASPHTASPDDQMQDSSAYHRPNEDHSELAWNGQPGDESAEHLRMLAPIQHENQQHVNGAYGSQLPNGQSNGMRPGYHKDESTGLITTNAGVQMDPKKRKRAFTNRTKTGCQTCRRRKKKCDEAKPECNNCTRGGFRCEGYTPRVSWPPDNKAKGPKQALPPGQSLPPTPRELQDLSGNLHPRPPPRPETQQYVDIPPQGHMRPRPLSIDDDQDRNMSNGWHQSPYAQSHRGYPMEHKDPVHGLPTHGMRDSYDRPISSMSGSSMHNMHPMQHMPPQPSPGIIGMAQQALGTHRIQPVMQPPTTPYANNPAVSNQHRMMWSGELYEHASSPLQRDREKCARLLHSFNRDSDLNYAKRMEDFDHILQLPHPSQINDPSSQARSRRGNMCVVDAPFRCEYGYNLRLGEHVTIESGCHISDPREVVIDSHSYIGPGVKILGKVLPLDPSTRANGIVSQARGFEIHIGQQVYIGANCVIQPDEELCKNGRLEIGNGSYIKPGSVVNKNVQPGVIYGPPGCDVISGVPMHPGAASGLAKGRSR